MTYNFVTCFSNLIYCDYLSMCISNYTTSNGVEVVCGSLDESAIIWNLILLIQDLFKRKKNGHTASTSLNTYTIIFNWGIIDM